MIGLLEVVGLAAALLTGLAWAGAVFLAPTQLPAKLAPAPRAARARLWLYAPLWLPTLLVGASVLPGLLGTMLGLGDHCAVHDGHHHHLCVLHPPHISNHPLVWSVAAAVLLPMFVALARAAWSGVEQFQLARALVRSSRASSLGPDVRLLDRDEPIALTVGFLRPVILLSQGLLDVVSPATLDVILAHERAHVRRRDTAWALLDTLVAALVPRVVRAGLLRELALSREQACDLWAAERAGRLRVAQALTRVARLGLSQPAVGMSVAASSLEARVLHLLEPPAASRWWPVAPVALLLVLAVLGAGPVHTMIERLVTLLLH